MKKILLLSALLCCLYGAAQQYLDFKPLRFDEDYSFLAADTTSGNWYKDFKYTPLSSSGATYLSFGGDIRYQYFYIHNEKWGDEPKDPDGYLFTRSLFHVDAHFGHNVRAYIELQSSTADGKKSTSPVDLNPMDLHQAFAEYSDTVGKSSLAFRVGRQELLYGSQRLVSVRDGPNSRQSFDAAKAMVKSGSLKADFFYSNFVIAQKDIFDDEYTNKRRFWGSYFTFSNAPLIKNLDVYYFGYNREDAFFNDGAGEEMRHSVGARSWGKNNGWRYDTEAIYQFGTLGPKNISAWTASVNAGYQFSGIRFKPDIGLKAEVISGDRKEGDNSIETLNPLFPRGGYFGLASVIGPSNLIDVHPSIDLELSKTIGWGIDYDVFWRYSTHDGIYAPSVAMIYPAGTSGAHHIGRQLESEIVYTPNQYLYFRFEMTWFDAGDYLMASGAGRDIIFAGITTQLKF